MTRSFIRTLKLGATLAVLGVFGSELEQSRADQDGSPSPAPAVVTATNAAPDLADAVLEKADGDTNQIPAITEVKEREQHSEINVSERVQKIIDMAEGGVGDDVLLAFVKSQPEPFNLTSEEILFLTDLGFSDEVLTAMIEHVGGGTAMMAKTPSTNQVTIPRATGLPGVNAPVATNQPAVSIAATPQYDAGAQPPEAQPGVAYGEPQQIVQPAPVQVNYFYNQLSPYGSWMYVADYGWCWRPTVAVVTPGWKPYFHRGRWVYSDYGWYWQSDYSWGWAAFHYGRWYSHPRCGWIWAPDTTWGPAWVTWRYSDNYCGWAPLPPGCRYDRGIGLTYHSARVGITFDFGLRRDCYNFVPIGRLCDRRPWHHGVPHHHVVNVYHRTRVVNNYIVDSRRPSVINEGIGRDRVQSLTRSEVRKVTIRDLPTDTRPGRGTTRPDRLTSDGKELAVYRPQVSRGVPGNAGSPRSSQEFRRDGGVRPTTPNPSGSPDVVRSRVPSRNSLVGTPTQGTETGSSRPPTRSEASRPNPNATVSNRTPSGRSSEEVSRPSSGGRLELHRSNQWAPQASSGSSTLNRQQVTRPMPNSLTDPNQFTSRTGQEGIVRPTPSTGSTTPSRSEATRPITSPLVSSQPNSVTPTRSIETITQRPSARTSPAGDSVAQPSTGTRSEVNTRPSYTPQPAAQPRYNSPAPTRQTQEFRRAPSTVQSPPQQSAPAPSQRSAPSPAGNRPSPSYSSPAPQRSVERPSSSASGSSSAPSRSSGGSRQERVRGQ